MEGERDAGGSGPPQTLGVLLVHGIGSQRHGDTLVHCTTALHDWLRRWLAPAYFDQKLTVDLVDTSVTEAGPDRPAHARIIFRRGNEVSRFSWLLAESCWFGTYFRPGFYEFARWALQVLPVSVVVHFLPRYRSAWTAFNASQLALGTGRRLSERDVAAIRRELGPAVADKKLEDLEQRRFLERLQRTMLGRLLGIQLKVALAAALGLVVQLLLLAVAVLAVVPGITRSLAGWVQKKLSSTLGDSYLFVSSPITGAAIFTRVKKDLEWLTARCDRVIVLAHSQGAAVSYQVIEREFWGGHSPEKLHALITYGSGLRKLFDLENVKEHLGLWTMLGGYAMAVSALMAGLVALLLSGVIPWWVALPGVAVGVLLQMLPFRAPDKIVRDPEVLRVTWHDHYSSHDPVPNGPIELATQDPSDRTLDAALMSHMDAVFVMAFDSRQREVVNRRSMLRDHTSYWSSPDDFVAGVADILAKASEIPIHGTLDEEWLKLSTARRRWRVTWLSRCRAVAGLAALSILLWPRQVLEPAGASVRALGGAAVAKLPAKLTAWAPDRLLPDWFLGAAGLMLAISLLFLAASAGWRLWERNEVARFFRRHAYPSAGVAAGIFTLGWIGVLALPPILALAHARVQWEGLFAVAWAPLTLAAWSAWMVRRSGPPPATPLTWARTALAQAHLLLADEKGDRLDALRSAQWCFAVAKTWLATEAPGSDEWVRAVLGEAHVIEEIAQRDPGVREKAPALYRDSIEALERAGRDASEVRKRLDRTKLG